MPTQLAQLGMQAAGSAVGAGMGMLLGAHERKQQIKQQQKLQDMQIMGQKEMGIFNREQQMKLWEDTNYSAQMGQLKKAGLNPGLIYGMGGGAGGTTQAATGSVSGGQARQGGEAMAMSMMGAQAALLAAQTENVKADTEKKKADTGLTGVTTDIAKLEKELKEYALPNAKSMTDQELSRLRTEVQMLWTSRDIQDATKQTEIDKKSAELTSIYAEIALKQAGITKTEEETKRIATEIGQMAQRLANETQKVAIEQQLADFQTKWGDGAGEILKQVIGNIPGIGLLFKKGGKK